MMTFTSNTLYTIILALASMAFFTLLERKILGYSQNRKGPNKVNMQGLPQPMADALKLFTKSPNLPANANQLPFLSAPLSNLVLALLLWTLFPSPSPSKFMSYGLVMFLCISSLSVYTTIASGWSSNSKYALLGSLRSIAQTISYEVTMALWLISTLLFLMTFNLQWITNNSTFMLLLLSPITFYVWMICLLAETNRTPFDFAEGESELVSGFNTEYASTPFAFIFMSEYLNIMIMSVLTSIIFMQKTTMPTMSMMLIIPQSLIIMFIFIITRATFPRMRYDRLMSLTWTSLLPLSLAFIMLSISMSTLWSLS